MRFLPNAITLMNLMFGTLSLYYTFNHQFHQAAIMILLAVVMDGMDGKVARRLNASGDFGKELDSLCDLVSFGAAPALLYIAVSVSSLNGNSFLNYLGVSIGIAYVLCGAFRLARFNILNISDYFVGLPITIAGFIIAIIYLYMPNISALIIIPTIALLGFFMVSRITIPKM